MHTILKNAASQATPHAVRVAQLVTEMPAGMRAAYIVAIQKELAIHGFDSGQINGTVTRDTVQAVRDYQSAAGLPVDGQLSRDLLDHLKFASPKIYRPGFTARATPTPAQALVIEIQAELKSRGYYDHAVDGLLGPITRRGIRNFQIDAGLPVTGEIDDALLDDLTERYPNIHASE